MTISLPRAKTLIVDDFQGMRTMFKDFCKSMGIANIETAGSGKDAIAMLGADKYDIVICDYNLGPGRNGQQVLEEAKQKKFIGYSTVWVMVTAEKTTEMVVGAVETKPDDYLLKPINVALLESRLNKLIEKKRSFVDIEQAVNAHDYAGAIALCDRFMKSQPAAAPELLRIKADLLLTMGDLPGVKALCESILAKRSVPWVKTLLGKIYFISRDYLMAKDTFKSVLDESPMYLEASDWLAKTHDALGEHDQAQSILQQAMRLSPNSPVRQKSLADSAYKSGALDVAQSAYEKAIKLGENSVHKSSSVYAGLAKVLTDKDTPNEALAVLERGKSEFRDDPETAIQAAVVQSMAYQKMGDHAKASAAIEEASKLAESLPGKLGAEVTVDMAKSLFKLGKKEEACGLLQNVVMENHEDASLLSQVEAVFQAEEMQDEGKALIEGSRKEVIDINNQGVMLAREGKFQEAIALLRTAVQRLPNSVAIVANLCGMIIGAMRTSGKTDELLFECKTLLTRIQELSPSHPKYHEYMNALAQLNKAH